MRDGAPEPPKFQTPDPKPKFPKPKFPKPTTQRRIPEHEAYSSWIFFNGAATQSSNPGPDARNLKPKTLIYSHLTCPRHPRPNLKPSTPEPQTPNRKRQTTNNDQQSANNKLFNPSLTLPLNANPETRNPPHPQNTTLNPLPLGGAQQTHHTTDTGPFIQSQLASTPLILSSHLLHGWSRYPRSLRGNETREVPRVDPREGGRE